MIFITKSIWNNPLYGFNNKKRADYSVIRDKNQWNEFFSLLNWDALLFVL